MSTTSTSDLDSESVGNTRGDAKIIPINQKPESSDLSYSLDQTSYSGHTATAKKLESAESFKDEDLTFLYIPKSHYEEKRRSDIALRVIRTQFSKDLICDLQWLAENHEDADSNSMPYISNLLLLLKEYFDNYFHDPFSSFLSALYDGLIHDSTYLSLTKNSYQRILDYIETLNNQDLDYKKIDKYISKLDDLGINVTPY
ncbi:MAG TPA: hypothetical protein PLX41_10510 [Bacteroidales bacterium]|nr:hypothetical protein [Bacteroidales bacterium]